MSASFPITETACPHCGYLLVATGAPSNPKLRPQPGDLALCIDCAQAMIFDPMMRPRKPRTGEVEALCILSPDLWSDMLRLRASVNHVNTMRKSGYTA